MFKNRKLYSSLLFLTLMCGGLVGCGHKPKISKPAIKTEVTKKEVKNETAEEKVKRIAKEYINLYVNVDYKTYSKEDYNKKIEICSEQIKREAQIKHENYDYYKKYYTKDKTQEKLKEIKNIKVEKITDKVYSFESIIIVENYKKVKLEAMFDVQVDISTNKITYFNIRLK
ncbi:hypothetical protein [Hathewaya limosa]|uniref:Lipoprotein n=1 Tax=Hathewaya limosa TaxID=1536 RepID=A0ABU0JU38_HATLI|nr:hypothetical protein [Hathewaya limosa]MDQ0480618.1 hypothetical protein [Hathewaya limosa]